jgi:AcrR family transcriptional regulator
MPDDDVVKLLDAGFALAVERGWRGVTTAELATRSGLPLTSLYSLAPDRTALLQLLTRYVDGRVLAAGPADPADPARDRLFEVLMRRFDALAPWKAGLWVVWADSRRFPLQSLTLGFRLDQSMGWMLEAAGLGSGGQGFDGISGRLRRRGLMAVWLSCLPTWFGDDSADQAATMARLDRQLSRADEIWQSLQRPLCSRQRPPAAQAPQAA